MERLNWEVDKKPSVVTVRKLAENIPNVWRNQMNDFLPSTSSLGEESTKNKNNQKDILIWTMFLKKKKKTLYITWEKKRRKLSQKLEKTVCTVGVHPIIIIK